MTVLIVAAGLLAWFAVASLTGLVLAKLLWSARVPMEPADLAPDS